MSSKRFLIFSLFTAALVALVFSCMRAETSVWQQSISVTSRMVYPAMLDDFNDGADPNNWGGVKSIASGGSNTLTAAYDSANAYGGSGYCLKLGYSVPSAGYVTLYMPLRPDYRGVDVSTYSYVSFMVKGTGAEKSFKVLLVASDLTFNSVYTVEYATMTASWQEIKIPFSAFSGLNTTKLQEIDFYFEYDYLNGKGYPLSGTVYLDDLGFKFN